MQDVVMFFMLFSSVVAVFWIIFNTIRRLKVARMQSEIHLKLIEKIGSSQECFSLLDSESGKQLLASISLEQPRRDPHSRIFASLQAGVILLLLGITFLILGFNFPNVKEGFSMAGSLAVALGAGFLISAALSYRLSKAFGLLGHKPTDGKLIS